jgi:hypothetical protein
MPETFGAHFRTTAIDAHPNARLQRCQSEKTDNTPVNTGVFASMMRTAGQWNKIVSNLGAYARKTTLHSSHRTD